MYIFYAHSGDSQNVYVLDILPGRWQSMHNQFEGMRQLFPGLGYHFEINAFNLNDDSAANMPYKPESFSSIKWYKGERK